MRETSWQAWKCGRPSRMQGSIVIRPRIRGFFVCPRAFHDIESRHATVEKSRVNELNHSKLKRSKEVFSSYFSILGNEAIPPFFFFPTRHLSSIVLMQNKIKRSLSFLIDVALFALIRLILVAINLLLTDRILNSRRRLLTLWFSVIIQVDNYRVKKNVANRLQSIRLNTRLVIFHDERTKAQS